MKKIILIIVILAVIGGAYAVYIKTRKTESVNNYALSKVETGDIRNYVSCTGTMETVGSVEVGTQVSGRVESIFVDFNDVVKKNQILAILDTLQLHLEVESARADVQKAQAQLDLSRLKYQDNIELHGKKFITGYDLKSSKADFTSASASLRSAEIRLEKAVINLKEYAFIRSPINGKIIDKAVEKGQTVSASLSAPTLFIIAEDLTKMEIHAMIDETDIGNIREGQTAEFTVDTYPDNEFSAVVKEVRLQPETISNVVNYTVVLSAENAENLLLPGMTATLEILTEEKKDVLTVDSSVLSYKPDEDLMKEIFSSRRRGRGGQGRSGNAAGPQGRKSDMSSENIKTIFFKDGDKIGFMPVKTGLSDGDKTEITALQPPEGFRDKKSDRPELKDGLVVLTKGTSGTTSTSSGKSEMRRHGPPGFRGGLF